MNIESAYIKRAKGLVCFVQTPVLLVHSTPAFGDTHIDDDKTTVG